MDGKGFQALVAQLGDLSAVQRQALVTALKRRVPVGAAVELIDTGRSHSLRSRAALGMRFAFQVASRKALDAGGRGCGRRGASHGWMKKGMA